MCVSNEKKKFIFSKIRYFFGILMELALKNYSTIMSGESRIKRRGKEVKEIRYKDIRNEDNFIARQ